MPPFQNGGLDNPGLWALPLLIGGILLARSGPLEGAWPPPRDGKLRPRRAHQSRPVLPPALVLAPVIVASLTLGTVAATVRPHGGWRSGTRAPAVVAAIVGAFVVQDCLH